MNEITKALVLEYKSMLTQQYAPASVNSVLSYLNGYFNYIERYDLKVKILKVQRQIFCQSEKELTKAEYERLHKAAKSKKNERLYLIMQTICATGIRVSELKYVDVNSVMTGQAKVRLKGKIRMILLPKELCQLLKKNIKEKHIISGSVFVTRKGQPVDRHSIWKSMKQQHYQNLYNRKWLNLPQANAENGTCTDAKLKNHIISIMCERGLIQEMPDINKDKTCCFFSPRKIDETAELKITCVEL